jgi:hypothetical protein
LKGLCFKKQKTQKGQGFKNRRVKASRNKRVKAYRNERLRLKGEEDSVCQEQTGYAFHQIEKLSSAKNANG